MVDETDPQADSDLRRRAAWLLLTLAVVAVLLVIVIGAVVHTGGKTGGSGTSGQGALDPQATSSSHPAAPPSHPASHRARPSGRAQSSLPSSHPAKSRHRVVGMTHCPTAATCILQGDVGRGLPAIDAYRASQGLPPVPGSVTPQAQQCALHNGDGCSGGWAETELSTPNGREAVHKMLGFARLDDPQMKSVGVGWAYDPAAKLYYFAIVRTD